MGKVALVHDFLTVYAGAERVLSELHQLYPDAPIYTLLAEQSVLEEHFPAATVITSPLQQSVFRNRKQFLLPWMPQAIESFDLSEYDVVISSSGAFSHGVITGPDTHHLCYCHSPMRYVWDWHAEYLRERGIYGGLPRFVAESMLHRIRLWDAISAKRVDTWIANSRTVASRIATFYRQPAQVIYPPVDTEYFNPEKVSATHENYLITASRLTTNKRVDQMILAASLTKQSLVVIGAGEERNSLEAQAKSLNADVRFVGSVSEETKRDLIAGARAFLFAAEDDFGIAPVEALALGVPVVALGKGGATETVQHGTNGMLYPEPTADSLAEGIRQLLASDIVPGKAGIRESALLFSAERFRDEIRILTSNAQ